jgi:hypothetical protein
MEEIVLAILNNVVALMVKTGSSRLRAPELAR